MAIIRKMEKIALERDTRHTEVDCTYSIISNPDGEKYLQIDTYGSTNRKIPGKKPIHKICTRGAKAVKNDNRGF